MNTHKDLPKWLYDYIFVKVGAKEVPDPNEFKLNLDAGVQKNQIYLGTYFPRSYSESFCIHQNLFSFGPYYDIIKEKTELKILSFGCGTGGDTVGLVCSIANSLPQIRNVEVVAYDGNSLAIDYLSEILDLESLQQRFVINKRCVPLSISSIEDLTHITTHIGNDYDFILSFKFVNELMQTGVWGRDGFKILAENLAPLLASQGLMTLLDVRAEYCENWQPKNLNKGLSDFCKNKEYSTLLPIPCHFNDGCTKCHGCFSDKRFTGSFTANDQVTYRVIGRSSFVDALFPNFNKDVTYIRNKDGMNDPCPMTKGRMPVDAFDINN